MMRRTNSIAGGKERAEGRASAALMKNRPVVTVVAIAMRLPNFILQ